MNDLPILEESIVSHPNPQVPAPYPTQLLHQFLKDSIQPGDTVIDATCGNGHDTLLLAQLVGSSGKVIATDIQSQAIESTRQHLRNKLTIDNLSLHQICHSQLASLAQPETISTIVFNLGYLPGTAHQITTTVKKTIAALRASTALLKPEGSLAVVCYTGHPGGQDEADAVVSFFENSNEHQTAQYGFINSLNPSPFLLFSTKRKI